MKELSIEQKAKAYDEALKKLRTMRDAWNNLETDYSPKDVVRDIEYYFPELADRENERIRTFLHHTFTAQYLCKDKLGKWHGEPVVNILAWLEKQGKQNWYTPVFTFDDVLALQCAMANAKVSDEKLYHALQSLHDRVHDAYSNEKQDEQKIQPKFEVGDTMRTLKEANSGITDGMPVVVSIDDKYYRCNNELIAIKDQDDYEYPPMNKKQKSTEWSEEVEAAISLLKHIAEEQEKDYCPHNANDLRKAAQYLETCRPQSTWKPSEEQMEVLVWCKPLFADPKSKGILESLINDLNKLREE